MQQGERQGEMREFAGCDNYGRERNEKNEEEERRKGFLVASLPSFSIDSSMETDSTGTGSNIS